MAVLFLGILLAYSPLIYARIALVEQGVVTNDFAFFVVFHLASYLLLACLLIANRWISGSFLPSDTSWLGRNKWLDVLGAIGLSILAVRVIPVLCQALGRLGIPARRYRVVFSSPSPACILAGCAVLVLLTPIVEEIAWRGWFQGVLRRASHWLVALVGQAVLFALLHMRDLAGTLPLVLIGLTFGIWRLWRRSLVPLIVAHMALNALWSFSLWMDYHELQMVGPTRDYRLPLEKLCMPDDYTPGQDSLPDYIRAFGESVEKPAGLADADLTVWPDDLPDEERRLLSEWVSLNESALAQFEVSGHKLYYFRRYSQEDFADVLAPPASKARRTVLAGLGRSQLAAAEGEPRLCVSDILACYRYGQHLAGPRPLIEQLIGLEIREAALRVAFRVLERGHLDETSLTRLQVELEALVDSAGVPVDFSGERLICHELIQRTFTDDGAGRGHIPRVTIIQMRNPALFLRHAGIPPRSQEEVNRWALLDRQQTTKAVDEVFAYLSSIQDRTPAQLRQIGKNVEDDLRGAAQANAFVSEFSRRYGWIYHTGYRCRSMAEALIVTIAVMRYQHEQGHLPDELQRLVQAGYLNELPTDPYSDSSFVYKKKGDDFLLYSLGPDFDDDSGVPAPDKRAIDGDIVFWPVIGKAGQDPEDKQTSKRMPVFPGQVHAPSPIAKTWRKRPPTCAQIAPLTQRIAGHAVRYRFAPSYCGHALRPEGALPSPARRLHRCRMPPESRARIGATA